MKTLVLESVKKSGLRYIIGVLMCIPVINSIAQDGQNDLTFNIIDRITAQGTNNTIKIAAALPDNKIVIGGAFTSYNGSKANKLARLNVDGKIDKSFNAGLGTDGTINTIAVQPNFKMIIAGDFTVYNGYAANTITRVNANGSLDRNFNAGAGANKAITKVLIQPDGKIIVAGNFTTFNNKSVKGLVRLNKNGSLDKTFDAELTDSLVSIHQVAMLPDGKLVIAGKARNFFGDMRNFIDVIRLNSNGSRDYTFSECRYSVGDLYPRINSIGIENDGNILLAGSNEDGSSSAPYHGLLMRFNTNGEMVKLMSTFWINSLALQTDGKILALGFNNPEWGIIKRVVLRMNQDLTVDSTFKLDDSKIYGDPSECSIETFAVQNNGKLVIGGNFFEMNGLGCGNIARLNTDGSFDDTFNQHKGSNGGVFASAKQASGKLIIGGEFSKFNSELSSNIARLKRNGELDLTFDVGSGVNGKIHAIAILSSGKIIIGGDFTSYNGNTCRNIAKLCADGHFDKSFEASFDDVVRSLTVDKNDNILVGGDFINANNVHRNAIARISENGILDTSFQPMIEETGTVYDCKIIQDERIYIAVNYKNTPELYIDPKVRCLNSDGTTDYRFHQTEGYYTQINSIALTRKNKILVAGFGHYSIPSFFPSRGIIARFNEDGEIDSTFNYKPLEQYLDKMVRTVSVLTDDRIIIGGDFGIDKTNFNHIAMLEKDGDINFDFVGNANGNIYSSTVTENNKILIGGIFSEYDSYVRNGVARISFDIVMEKQVTTIQQQDAVMTALNVYPNPAVSSVTIDHMEKGNQIRIYNETGIEMFSGIVTSEMQSIDLSNYSNGVYFIMTEKNGVKANSKFVIAK